MKIKISFCIFASLLLTSTLTDAALEGNWPPTDHPPPPVAEWTALVDTSKIPKAPLSKKEGGDSCVDNDPFCDWSCTLCTRNDSDIVKCPNKNDWGITFDDGPTEYTNALLDFLETKNVKVTFFVIGSRVFDNPEILKRAVKNGHQIGVHTWSHPYLTTQSNEEIIAEIKWTEAAIKAAVGLTPKYMRPPFGDFDDRVRSILTQLGYKIVIWDEDTNDWMSDEDKTFQLTWIEGNFTQWVKEPSNTGHISLEHDLYQQTAERGQLTVPIVLNAGYNIKPVAVCVGDPQPYVENVSLDTSTSGATPDAAPAPAPAPAAYSDPASNSSSYPSSSNSVVGSDPYQAQAQSSSSDPYASPSTSEASLNIINLWSFISLIVGSFYFHSI